MTSTEQKPPNDSDTLNQNPNPEIKPTQSITDRPIGGGKNLDDAPIGGSSANNAFLENDGGKDLDNTLEGRLKSGDAKVRLQAYTDLINWNDPDYTPAIFAKGLHLTIKEKDANVLDKLLTAIENLMDQYPSEYASIDMKKFLPNFAEFLMNSVKGPSKDHCVTFIIKLWDKCSDKKAMMELFKGMIVAVKVKLQEKALLMVYELLKAGKIEEMEMLKPLYPDLEKLIVSRTASIKTQAFDIYKEAFLWLGDVIKTFISGFKEAQKTEFETYMKGVDPKTMKTLKKDGEKGGKKLDAYNMFAEAELPKKYNDDQFEEDVINETKWSNRKKLLDELNDILEKTPKLSQKTNAFIYMNLARKIFLEPNVAVQTSIIRTLGFLASGMRKGFAVIAKTMFPVLLAKLKEKNRALSDEIMSSLEKFFFCMTFEESYQEIEESLADKNPEKKKNVLNLLSIMNDKLELIKTPANSIKITKLIVKMTDENDQAIREKVSELIARQLDAFEDKINPILKDLNSQKMAKIMKYRQKMASIPIEAQGPGQPQNPAPSAKQESETGERTGAKGKNFHDKSQMIAKTREEVFSNKIVKITEIRLFSQYLFKNLYSLTELTKEFKEITSAQATEIFLFIDEIVQKVDKQVLIEDSRKIIAQFYIEQLLGKSSDELNTSLERYMNCSSKVVNQKLFLQDLLNVLTKKTVKLNKELLTVVLKLYEEEVQSNNRLANFPHSLFVEFLKIYFSIPNIHVSMKLPLINTMRIVSTKFGEKATNDFPQVLFKELSSQNSELQKVFEKTYEKLTGGDPEKNRQAISELNSCDDHSKISYFWSQPSFITYLNRQLNYDGEDHQFGSMCQIVSNYLLIKSESPIDFKIKSYLMIFQTILSIHYNGNNVAKKGETDKIVNQTVETIGAAKILNEMISDTSLSSNKFQILSFYFEFAYAIEPNLKIINYLSNIIEQRGGVSSEIKTLLELVLLLIKNTNNDEVIVKGSENRFIRDVWQKREIDLLINENLVYGSKLFEDQTTYNMIKQFLSSNLKMEDAIFYSYEIDTLKIGNEETPLKLKLAYYYLRSVENIRKNCLFILNEIHSLNLAKLNREEILIGLKTIFNILRNLVYMQSNESFKKGRDFFADYINRAECEQEIPSLFNLNSSDHQFYIQLIKRQEIRYSVREEEHDQDGYEKDVDVSYMRPTNPIPVERGNNQKAQKNNRNNQLKSEETQGWNTQPKQMDSPSHGRSIKKKANNQIYEATRKVQNDSLQRDPVQRAIAYKRDDYSDVYSNDVSYIVTGTNLERPEMLNYHFDNLKSFDQDRSDEARKYFEDLCKSSSPTASQFLCNYSNEIMEVYVGCIENIFQEGINYSFDRSTYEILFIPLQMLFVVDGFLASLKSEILNYLVDEILIRLVTANEEKQSNAQNNEEDRLMLSEFMIKFWNSLMLKIIERAEPNNLINSLFTTVMNVHTVRDKTIQTALFNLAIRCLSKISKNLKKVISVINPNNVFVLVHNYIQQFGIQNSETVGTKTMKSLINELVLNYDLQEIWMHYDQTFGEENEQVIIKWIKIVQNKMVENRMIEIIQQCEARGTNQAVSELVDFYLSLKEIVPELQMLKYSDFFQDAGFFEKVMVDIPPEMDPKAFSKNGNQGSNPNKTGNNPNSKNKGTNNRKKSVDRFKKQNNDHFLDKSEISNYSEVSEIQERNQKRRR